MEITSILKLLTALTSLTELTRCTILLFVPILQKHTPSSTSFKYTTLSFGCVNYQALRRLNIYDILEPCYHSPNTEMNTNLPSSFQQLGQTTEKTTLAVRKRMFGRAWPFRAPVRDGIVPLWPQLARSHNITHESTVPCMVSFLFLFSHSLNYFLVFSY